MHPSEHSRAQPHSGARLRAAEIDHLWTTDMPAERASALEQAVACEADACAQLAIALAEVDEQTRATFVRALGHALAWSRPPTSLVDAGGETLGRTRIAAFWVALATPEQPLT